jgi:dynein heavy chain
VYVQDPVVARLKDVVDDFKELLPLVQELGNPALQAQHWQDIFDIIGASIPTNASGTGRWCLSEPGLHP